MIIFVILMIIFVVLAYKVGVRVGIVKSQIKKG